MKTGVRAAQAAAALRAGSEVISQLTPDQRTQLNAEVRSVKDASSDLAAALKAAPKRHKLKSAKRRISRVLDPPEPQRTAERLVALLAEHPEGKTAGELATLTGKGLRIDVDFDAALEKLFRGDLLHRDELDGGKLRLVTPEEILESPLTPEAEAKLDVVAGEIVERLELKGVANTLELTSVSETAKEPNVLRAALAQALRNGRVCWAGADGYALPHERLEQLADSVTTESDGDTPDTMEATRRVVAATRTLASRLSMIQQAAAARARPQTASDGGLATVPAPPALPSPHAYATVSGEPSLDH
jgi:hypothetical protein